MIALLAAGVFPVPLDPRLTAAERDGILADVRPALVVDSPERSHALAGRVSTGSTGGLPLGRPMHVTSGTTGRPKAVDSGLLDPRRRPRPWSPRSATCGASRRDDVNLVLSPLYHSAPLRFAMGTLLAGGRMVVPGPFDPAAVTAAIEARAADLDVLRADPPAAALRALGRASACPTCRASGWSRTPARRARRR